MNDSPHIPIERVRAYLLGKLDEAEADRLEDSYFCERSAFLRVQSIEDDLIRDYLRGNLPPADSEAFEARYTKTQELAHRLEEIRESEITGPASQRSRPPFARSFWKPVLAVALVSALAVFLRVRQESSALPSLTLALSPGVTMGANSTPTILLLPGTPAPVKLTLELPGQKASLLCTARISQVMADGTWKQVWVSERPQATQAIPGGQNVVFMVDSHELSAQDYVVEVMGPDRSALESYVFSGRASR